MKKINSLILAALLAFTSTFPSATINNSVAFQKRKADSGDIRILERMIHSYKNGYSAVTVGLLEEIIQNKPLNLQKIYDDESDGLIEHKPNKEIYEKLKKVYNSIDFGRGYNSAVKNILVMSLILENNIRYNLVEEIMKKSLSDYDKQIRKNEYNFFESLVISDNYLIFLLYQLEKNKNGDHNSTLKKLMEIFEEAKDNDPFSNVRKTANIYSSIYYNDLIKRINKEVSDLGEKELHLSKIIQRDYNMKKGK